MNARRVIGWSGVVLAAVVAIVWWGWHRQVLLSNQIRNTVIFNVYRSALGDYYESNGRFPETLDNLPVERPDQFGNGRDQWGFPLIYETDGHGYILASSGKGGKSDGHDYWRLRKAHQDDSQAVNICMKWGADQIASDRGWHQVCGK